MSLCRFCNPQTLLGVAAWICIFGKSYVCFFAQVCRIVVKPSGFRLLLCYNFKNGTYIPCDELTDGHITHSSCADELTDGYFTYSACAFITLLLESFWFFIYLPYDDICVFTDGNWYSLIYLKSLILWYGWCCFYFKGSILHGAQEPYCSYFFIPNDACADGNICSLAISRCYVLYLPDDGSQLFVSYGKYAFNDGYWHSFAVWFLKCIYSCIQGPCWYYIIPNDEILSLFSDGICQPISISSLLGRKFPCAGAYVCILVFCSATDQSYGVTLFPQRTTAFLLLYASIFYPGGGLLHQPVLLTSVYETC
ncbi:uncharacterized protein [Elaeis guineensis]|uniref:uncharacterized protein n=1 Tax=Elaeis guineensis var. tenera TaxID=51953 RepID=UPI003C6D48BC